ncbi:hypothetical protein D9O50_09140 [Oxalobacteraceae bacterium CAVE-383]|nr:hypothetical protein D9O50_09140 [Oxalobacteraceae bacterium CAVE-383]
MIAACDALDSFIREWASTDWLAFPQSAINIATKATTNSNGREWSVFDRLKTLADVLQVDDVDAYLALVSLGSRWRNALVHMGRARFELDKNVRSILKSPKTKQILGVKAGFDITETIKKFDSAEDPSLKDVTTILAYMQDVCRQLDQAAICRVADTEDKVEVLLKNALKIHFITRGELDEFWGIHRPNEWIGGSATASYAVKECMNTRLPEYQPKWERKFSNLLNSLGFSMSEHPVSHEISSKCVGFLASMSACDFAKEVGL